MDDYISVLILMAHKKKWSTDDLSHANAIFSHLASEVDEKIIPEDCFRAEFLGKFRDAPIFPASDGGWCSARGIYLNDDRDVAEQFRGHEAIRFVHEDLTAREGGAASFCRLCGVQPLSRSVRKTTTPYGATIDAKLSLIIKEAMPLIQRWIFWKRPSRYDGVAAAVEGRLPLFRAFLCDEVLQFSYLAGVGTVPLPRAVALDVDEDKHYLYASRAAAADYHAVFSELSRWFNEGLEDSDLALFAATVTATRASAGSVDGVLRRSGCWDLFPCDADAREALARQPRPLPAASWGELLPSVEAGADSYSRYLTDDPADALPTAEPRPAAPKRGPVAAGPRGLSPAELTSP